MIQKVIDAMQAGDYVALSECFAPNGRLFDYCPAATGQDNSFIYGPRAVDMFYHNKFVLGGLSIQDPMIVDERTVNYYASYGGPIVHVVANIESYDPKSGLIREMVIRPA